MRNPVCKAGRIVCRHAGAAAPFPPADEPGNHALEEEAGVALCLQARYSDLLIIGQDDPDEALLGQGADLPAYAVMNAGRPMFIVPYAGQFDRIGNRVVVAWDGGLQAARAITTALPILKQAQQVQVAMFDPEAGSRAHGELPEADIGLYLVRHGVKVECSRKPAGDDMDIGNALLSHLADCGADLLVMGGYGHSRFREILRGGVTRTILSSMTVPVLMAQ
jgi:nucleotide-binding universal stress UspA family protein